MKPIDAIDIGSAAGAEHGRIALCRPPKTMRCRVGLIIGFGLDHTSSNAANEQCRADQVSSHSLGRTIKKFWSHGLLTRRERKVFRHTRRRSSVSNEMRHRPAARRRKVSAIAARGQTSEIRRLVQQRHAYNRRRGFRAANLSSSAAKAAWLVSGGVTGASAANA